MSLHSIIERVEPETILVVDDDADVLRFVVAILTSSGFNVLSASSPEEAIQISSGFAGTINLLLTDVMLPGMDGHQVLGQLRRISHIPVLMLTGRGAEDDLIAGLEGGADDYLLKTASSREFATRVRALLRRAAVTADKEVRPDNAPPLEVRSGALSMQSATRSVTVDDKPIVLTSVEFDLLSILVRHKGQVLTREQLLKEVRNRDFAVFDRAIDVHIASLRKKLGDDAREARFIRTVRAVGYLFIDPAGSVGK